MDMYSRPPGAPPVFLVISLWIFATASDIKVLRLQCVALLESSHRAHTAQLSVQTTFIFLGERWSIGVEIVDRKAQRTDATEKAEPHNTSSCWGHMCVFVQREHSQNIVVLVNRFAPVPPLLLVRPVAMGVAELSLDFGWVDVAAILYRR